MKQMNKYAVRFAVLFTGLFFLYSGSAAATDSLITVGIYQNPPKVYFGENGKPVGIFVELLEEIARLENWQLNYVSCTWNNCLTGLGNGEIDLMPDVALTFERIQRFAFNTVPVIESWSQVYANPNITVTTLSDLEGKNIALVEGSVHQPFFHQIMNGFGYPFREVHASSFPDAFAEVKIGIADAAVVNNFYGEANYKNYNLQKTTVIFSPAVLHFATTKGKNAWIIEKIDEYLTEWQKTPQSFYYKTIAKYVYQEEFTEKPVSRRIFFFVIAGTLFAGFLIVLLLQYRINKKTKELIKTNKKLKYEEQKFRGYIEHAPYGVFVANEHGKYVDINQTACKITGYSKEEIIGKNIPDLIAEEKKDIALNHYNTVVKEGKAVAVLPYITKNGEKRLWNVIAVKISPKRLIGFVEDVTEDTKLRNRLLIMDNIFNQSVNEIYLFDSKNLQFRYVNEAAEKNTGYSHWELTKMTPLDLKLNLLPSQFDILVQPLIKKEKKTIVFETQHFRKDGTHYDAEIYLQLLDNENEKLFSAVVLDVTERKKSEKELLQVRERLEKEVNEKTRELNDRIAELENFREATIERELRMEELRKEIEWLKNERK